MKTSNQEFRYKMLPILCLICLSSDFCNSRVPLINRHCSKLDSKFKITSTGLYKTIFDFKFILTSFKRWKKADLFGRNMLTPSSCFLFICISCEANKLR